MLTTPPPPPFVMLDDLPVVALSFAEHIAAEHRRAWTADTAALRVSATPDGALVMSCRGFPPATLEPAGLRALLTFFNDLTPRSHPTLSRLSPATFAAVWRDLWSGPWPRPDDFKVHERARPGGGMAVWSVTAPTFGGGGAVDTVAALVAMVARELAPAPPVAALEYDPETPGITLRLGPPGRRGCVVVEVNEQPSDRGPVVTAYDEEGRSLGDPLPTLRPRRRTGMETFAQSIADKYRAACALTS